MVSRATKILLIANVLWILGEGMLGPLFAVFTAEIGGSILDISFAWAIYLAVTGVGIIIAGRLSDSIGKEKMMIAGYAINTIFTFGYLMVDSPFDLFIIQIGLGVGLALAQPTWMALYDKYSGDGDHDGFIWGLSDGVSYIASAVAILIGGLIVSYFSFDILFMIMGTFMLLSTLYQARILSVSRAT